MLFRIYGLLSEIKKYLLRFLRGTVSRRAYQNREDLRAGRGIDKRILHASWLACARFLSNYGLRSGNFWLISANTDGLAHPVLRPTPGEDQAGFTGSSRRAASRTSLLSIFVALIRQQSACEKRPKACSKNLALT